MTTPRGRPATAPVVRGWPTLLALALAAAWYFHGIIDYSFGWADEGHIVYPSWQVSEGALPYVSFQHLYAPSVFFLNGTLLWLFGPDLRVVRLFLVPVKVAVVLLVFSLSRRVARPAVALVMALVLVIVWGMPGWFFNAPYATYYATALCLLALVALEGRSGPRPFAAGILLGCAATFKQTQGIFAATSVALFLTFAMRAETRQWPARLARAIVPLAALALAIAYLGPHLLRDTTVVLLVPLAAGVAATARGSRTANLPAAAGTRAVLLLAAGTAVAPLAYGLFYWSVGGLEPLLADTFVELPRALRWFVPLTAPGPRGLLLAAALGGSLAMVAAYGGRRTSPGRLRATTAGLGLALAAIAWHLRTHPELRATLGRGGWLNDLFPLLGWLPFAVLAVTARGALGSGTESASQSPRLLWLFAAGAVLQLYPAADLPHAVFVLPSLLPVLALAVERFLATSAGGLRGAFRTGAFALGLGCPLVFALPFLRSRATFVPPAVDPTIGFARATGITDAPPTFTDAVALVAYLSRQARPDGGALVICNEQMLYFLAGIRSPLPRDEYVLFAVEADLMAAEEARRMLPEETIVRTLEASRPLIVDFPASPAGRRFRATYPTVARFVDAHYREAAAFGGYRVAAFTPSDASESTAPGVDSPLGGTR